MIFYQSILIDSTWTDLFQVNNQKHLLFVSMFMNGNADAENDLDLKQSMAKFNSILLTYRTSS